MRDRDPMLASKRRRLVVGVERKLRIAPDTSGLDPSTGNGTREDEARVDVGRFYCSLLFTRVTFCETPVGRTPSLLQLARPSSSLTSTPSRTCLRCPLTMRTSGSPKASSRIARCSGVRGMTGFWVLATNCGRVTNPTGPRRGKERRYLA